MRNEPQLVKTLGIGWDALAEFQVQEHPNLMVSVPNPDNEIGRVLLCEVFVRVDRDRQIVFVRDAQHDLPRADRGGRALATLFEGDRRRVAQAWRSAWDLAESGQTATHLELAEQKDKRRQDEIEMNADIENNLAAIQTRTGSKGRSAGKIRQRRQALSGKRTTSSGTGTNDANTAKARILVDPDSLKVVNPYGRRIVGNSKSKNPQKRRGDGLVEPHGVSQTPRNKVALRGYSDLDRENVGFELARKVLSSDHDDIVDIRTQCGVGADAMDQLGRFYELKVYAGDEPNSITLTDSELQRAKSTPHFFLVVVSGVEGIDARPTMRIIPRPLDQLEQSVRGTMVLSGVREARRSLVYGLAPLDEPVTGDNEEDPNSSSD